MAVNYDQHRLIFLLDGEITEAEVSLDENLEEMHSFTVRVISSGKEFSMTNPFNTLEVSGKLYLVWQLRNGQIVTLPMTEGARKGLLDS